MRRNLNTRNVYFEAEHTFWHDKNTCIWNIYDEIEQFNNWCETMWPNQINLKEQNVFYKTDFLWVYRTVLMPRHESQMCSRKSKTVQEMVLRTDTEDVHCTAYTVLSVSSNSISLSRDNDGDTKLSSSFANSWFTMISLLRQKKSEQISWCQIFQVCQPKMAHLKILF